jgi:hypothetical protein
VRAETREQLRSGARGVLELARVGDALRARLRLRPALIRAQLVGEAPGRERGVHQRADDVLRRARPLDRRRDAPHARRRAGASSTVLSGAGRTGASMAGCASPAANAGPRAAA